MKLGKRLKHIESLVTPNCYAHIWDCCCDHGLLGARLLSRRIAPYIHFVDIVPKLMNDLERKLQHFYPNSSSTWKVHCLDVAALPIDQHEGKNLVIIAGVGGDLITQLVSAIYRNHASADIDFLLSPVYHQFTLRQQLIELDFNLKNELLVEENNRFYEILLVSSHANTEDTQTKISPVGDLIWQADTSEQSKITENYLHKTLDHYQRMQQGKNADIQHIIDAYRAVNICLQPSLKPVPKRI